jgi:hypothetical protein
MYKIAAFFAGALLCALALPFVMLPLAAFAQDATGSGTVGSVVDQLCSDKAGLTGLLGYGLTAIGGASILANFRRLMPGPLATIVDFLAANWFRIFEALSRSALDAKPPASRVAPMIAFVFAIGLGLSLTACSQDQNAKIAATATAIDQTVAAVQPVVNVAACKAQEAANLTTAALTQSHNTDAAAKSASASALLGLLCFTTPSAPIVAAAPAA